MASAYERRKRANQPSSAVAKRGEELHDLLEAEAPRISLRARNLNRVEVPPPVLAPLRSSVPPNSKASGNIYRKMSGMMSGMMGDSMIRRSLSSRASSKGTSDNETKIRASHEAGDVRAYKQIDATGMMSMLRDSGEATITRRLPASYMDLDSSDSESEQQRSRWRGVVDKVKRKSVQAEESARDNLPEVTSESRTVAKWAQKAAGMRAKAIGDVSRSPLVGVKAIGQAFTTTEIRIHKQVDIKFSPAAVSVGSPGLGLLAFETSALDVTKVTPWETQDKIRKTSATADFMKLYPPPPVPETPTKSGGRSLRAAKSDSSIRMTASGAKLAPEILPAQHSAAVDITNPVGSPTLYVSQSATTEAVEIPEDADLAAAIQMAKSSWLVAKRERDHDGKSYDDYKHDSDYVRKLWRKNGDKLIARASRYGFAPKKEYSSMTDNQVEAVGWAIDREASTGGTLSMVQKMFRHVGEVRARDAIAKRVCAQKKRWLLRRAEDARSEGRLGPEHEQIIRVVSGFLEEAMVAIDLGKIDEAAEIMKTAGEELGEEINAPPQDVTFTPTLSGSLRAEHWSAESERMRTFQALCVGESPAEPARTDEPTGLGITLGAVETDAALLTTPQRPPQSVSRLRPSTYTPAELDSFMTSARSSSQLSPEQSLSAQQQFTPTSPHHQKPLKVQLSPLAPVDKFGNKILKPLRNSEFHRKIQQEQANRAKDLRCMGSHPALRRQRDGGSPAQKGSVTAPMIELNDCFDFDLSGSQIKHDSILKQTGNVQLPQDEYVVFAPSVRSAGRQSLLDWDDDEKSGAALLFGQLDENCSHGAMSALEKHIRLSRLSKFMELRYPGSPQVAEATDNEEVEASVIHVELDDAIADWQYPKHLESPTLRKQFAQTFNIPDRVPDTTHPGKPSGVVDELTLLRLGLGLPLLQTWKQGLGPKHPCHGFLWETEKIMCSIKHTGQGRRIMTPPCPVRSSSPHANALLDLRSKTERERVRPVSPERTQLQRCVVCHKFCCAYASALLTSTISATNPVEKQIKAQAEEKVMMLRSKWPNGVETFDTFLPCAKCERVVCRACAKVCSDEICAEVACVDCVERGGACACSQV
ncbi:hypothetical protein LTR62_004703 [Meristemomyces frigidus]|uniref:Uncharacterized protein n=1 Tax=Meristemomyces frigidus TaxID=1508187 RepID=A0AAN7YJS0_9PEZI|nr:hypothetical protein LTR62_004703 [Meristemomyces frigidus]